ncbi:FliM/FliN family flagellar motor switch protein [Buttiauxella massiliensis]|uniref:FliM/FliN family flagellar motor switch protein n=1 Tax=Buttiauxella massiliensis TaxID=2831590 RepID=UPI00125FB784|nr:FliM/FliN family flagellar motor switch protein [Buttiauxella massiliensis]
MSDQNDLSIDFNLDEIDLPETAGHDADISAAKSVEKTATESRSEQLRKMALFSRIPVNLTLEVASVSISLAELMTISNDSVIELDKMAGEPLDLKVNGIQFGKAEVVVLNDKYGLRIIEFSNHDLGKLTQ